MGLFKNKSVCAICGGKAGILKTVIKDGKICPDCRKKLSKNIDGLKFKTVDDIKRHLEYRKQNEAIFKNFNVTSKAGNRLFVDKGVRKFYVATDDKKCTPDVFDFSQLVDYRIEEDGNSIKKSEVVSAIENGLLFGDAGAADEGLADKKNNNMVRSLNIVLTVRSEWIKTVTIPIINTEIQKGSKLYKLSKPIFESCISILDEIIRDSKLKAQTVPEGPSTPISASDEVLKYMSLLDAGAITQDEFDAKKKQLLG